ncbi:bifunctional 2-polyprenyl-6-hydroxyphenol methylase/3-demethylubiquinol 3-O-methyltransferase UbiG [Jiulongibacter sediminis]|uniref:class I SAM-dependent methyltransferase n=1 Tax=Jiulongibacter sediminis TaxID=1605367 RepID=UPI0026F2F893|nr:class I SAM-dependent methyltransferase [Jiulongibacter sediminis]
MYQFGFPYNSKYGLFVKEDEDFLTNYSEGSKAESYIFEILKNAKDTSVFSEELQSKIKDWSTEYHFSPYRSNILRPVEITPDLDVLEVGAGTGVITRFLGETGANIIAVEGALDRAKCISERCKGLENVKVICSNVELIQFEKKFDIITLIGVFEYTDKYSKKDSSFFEALQFYRSLLKPNGKLVIAIENKLGLKYFAGYNEDHYGEPYIGLENRYEKNNVRTFGRVEILSLLELGGFFNNEILYPFPDYKLSKAIITNLGLFHKSFNSIDLIRNLENRHYSYSPKENLLDERAVWETLHENNILHEMSNSFLIISKVRSEKELGKPILGQYFNCDRKNNWSTQIDIFDSHDNSGIVCKKQNINGGNPIKKSNLIEQILPNKPTNYIEGDNLHSLIEKALRSDNYILFEKYINLWIVFLINEGITIENKINLGLSVIKGDFYDCTPSNIILDQYGKLHFFDREWNVKVKLNLYFPLLKYLSRFGYRYLIIGFLKSSVQRVLVQNNIEKPKWRDFQSFKKLESEILNEVHFDSISLPINRFKSLVLLVKKLMRDFKLYLIRYKLIHH